MDPVSPVSRMRFLVLGAGMQGQAVAYDLLRQPDVTSVTLADARPDVVACPALEKLSAGDARFHFLRGAAYQVPSAEVDDLMSSADVVLSALPYYLNASLAETCVRLGVHFADLGGNAEVVAAQLKLIATGCAIVPDNGLAPGMINILGEKAIQDLGVRNVERLRLYVGGLPQDPKPPLNYQLVYSMEGVLDYYTTPSWVLRGGVPVTVEALSELEHVTIGSELEAFHTAGGLSMMAFRYENIIPEMEYKTLRYPGHARLMRMFRELGFFEAGPVRASTVDVLSRALKSDDPDMVVAQAVATASDGRSSSYTVIDRHDGQFSAMARTTGFSLAIIGVMLGRGLIAPGVNTPDVCVDAGLYMSELSSRGIEVVHDLSHVVPEANRVLEAETPVVVRVPDEAAASL